jgi:hypothetical protein
MRVIEGFEVPHLGIFEPVRERRRFARTWHDLQPVAGAAAKIGAQLRPDSN